MLKLKTLIEEGDPEQVATGFQFTEGPIWQADGSLFFSDIPGNRNANARTLKHEQTHFDITEIFARKLRKSFEGATGLCPDRPKDARKLFDRLSEESQDIQSRYDNETAHGMSFDAQTRWTRSVEAGLDSLKQYRQD